MTLSLDGRSIGGGDNFLMQPRCTSVARGNSYFSGSLGHIEFMF